MEQITIQNMGLVDLALTLSNEALEDIKQGKFNEGIEKLMKSQSFLKVVKIGLL